MAGRRRHRLRGAALAVAVLLGGCSGGSPSGPGAADQSTVEADHHDDHGDQHGAARREGDLDAESTSPRPSDSSPELLQATRAAQRPYLEDDQVTAAEHEAAFAGWVSCLQENRLTVGRNEITPDGKISIVYHNQAFEPETVERIGDDCRKREFRIVQHVFFAQNSMNAIELADWLADVVECADGPGIEASQSVSVLVLFDQAPDELGDCLDVVYEKRTVR